MGGIGDRVGLAGRWAVCCAALAAALALSGCGLMMSVGSTVYSGGEALATIAKQAADGEGGSAAEPGAQPE